MSYFTKQDINNLYNHHYTKKELENLRYTYKNRINTYKNKNITESIKTCSLNQFSQSKLKELSNNYTLPVLIKNYFKTGFDPSFNLNFINNEIIQVKNAQDKIVMINHNTFNRKIHTIFNDSIKLGRLNLNKEFLKKSYHIDRFVSNINNITHLHNEINATLNIQFKGTKEWILINPNYYDFLIPSYFKDMFGTICFSHTVGNNDFNILKIKCPHIKITIEKGDILFVPSWWWHQVRSLDNSISYSIRTVYINPYHSIYNNNRFMCNMLNIINKKLLHIYLKKTNNQTSTYSSAIEKYKLEHPYFKN